MSRFLSSLAARLRTRLRRARIDFEDSQRGWM